MKQIYYLKLLLLIMAILPVGVLAQGTVTGTVTDDTSQPLPGVTIVVKGTTTGAITDFDGNYSISASNGDVLVFSFVGFDTQEITVASTTINVAMQAGVTLDEVVITGLATSIKRTNAANAVASVSADDLVGRTPPQTLDGALAGKFTGAVVSANSGAPGGGLSIKLRGVTSINSNSQPLYIIDGVYLDNSSISAGLNAVSAASAGGSASNQDNPSNRIADINPDDIEKIEILKGASAAAIYGSRAAAGVILITTKRGKAGKTKININQSFGFNEAINLLGTRNFTEATVLSSFGASSVPLFTAARDSGQLHDYEKELYGENGFVTNTNIGISGGNEKTTFFTGFSHNEEDGIVKNTGFIKNSFRINLDHKINDNIKLSLNTNYINTETNRGFFNNDNSGTTIGVSLVGTPPWAQLFPENGIYPDNDFGASNPLQTRDLVTNREKVNRFITGGSIDINIYRNDNSSLKAILRAGLDYYTLATRAIFPKDLQFESVDGGDNGVSIQGTTENRNVNYSAFLVHNYRTNNDFSFTTQAGITKEVFSRNTILSTAKNLVASETNLDQAGSLQVAQTRLEQEDQGFFAQEEVNFQDKIIATFGIRGDKSTNNGDANELFYYPKASVAFNLHNFSFWKDNDILNRFKVRAAYGESGNFAPNGALFTSFGSTTIGGAGLGITLNGVLGDINISPERQKEFEVGFDAGFFNNKVSLEFTYYKKQVEDLILNASTEPSSGFTSEFVNAGELENTGIEIGLNIKAFDTEDFSWDSGISFWTNDSEITQLDIPAFNLGAFGATLGTFRIEEGKSATQIVGISENGQVVHGDAEADFQMSFDNTIRYKDFELSFLWHWKEGGDNVNLSTLLFDLNGTTFDFDATGLDPSGTLTNGPYRLSRLGVSADVFVQDASYLRLREAGLYYNIPNDKLTKWFGNTVAGVKIGVSGTNLINIFDYDSYDPEVSNFGSNGISTGVEVLPFPSSKRYMFHLSVNF